MTPPSEHAIPYTDVAPVHPVPDEVDRVRIAVLAQLDIPGLHGAGRQINLDLTRSGLQCVVDAGGQVDFHDMTAEEDPDLDAIRAADAIVVLGGGDVDATLYGFTDPVPNEGGVDRRSDDRELAIIRDAIERDAALLGICRGSQLLNVACGGSLIPDVQPFHLHHGAPGQPLFVDEQIELVPGTLVYDILGQRDTVVGRTGHHQAVNEVADALQVTARAQDGVVEGTQHRTATWVLGVQWHPEDEDGDERDRAAMFQAVIDEARRRRSFGD